MNRTHQLGLAALATLLAQSAGAATLPQAGASGFAADDASPFGSLVYGPALAAVGGSGINAFGDPYADSASSLLEAGNPTVRTAGNAGSWAQAALVFYYEVVGPAAASVPVILTGTVSASADAVAGAHASAQINPGTGFSNSGPRLAVCAATTPGCGSGTQQLTGSLSFSVAANSVQGVYLLSEINALAVASGSYSAFADPDLRIDPSFANAGQYSIVFSAGVVPSVVPEPATVALLLPGLIGLALRVRRARS